MCTVDWPAWSSGGLSLKSIQDWGKDLLKRLTIDTIINGIKYERRLKRGSKY